jgi:adenosine deaminase
MAELAVDFRSRGCVGFDLAGDEFGHPPKDHLEAFQYCKRQNFNITIHAGVAFGPPSIWQALQFCGAHRIGHGVRLIEDISVHDGKVVKLGYLAQYILDHRIPLEICLSSNLQTGAVQDLKDHPFRILKKYNFRVTLNSDNRLMSQTDATSEYWLAAQLFDLSFDDLEKLTINAMKSAFIPYRKRCDLIFEILKPGFAQARAALGLQAAQYPRRGASL